MVILSGCAFTGSGSSSPRVAGEGERLHLGAVALFLGAGSPGGAFLILRRRSRRWPLPVILSGSGPSSPGAAGEREGLHLEAVALFFGAGSPGSAFLILRREEEESSSRPPVPLPSFPKARVVIS